MKCKNKSLVIALVTLIFSIILIPAGHAAIAVKEGDWAKYKIEAEIPDTAGGGMPSFDDVDWMKYEVKSVSGSAVTVEATMRFKNGTELKETVDGLEASIIVDTTITESGESVTNFPSFGLVGSIMPGDAVVTNGTESRQYAGVIREVQYSGIEMAEAGYSFAMNASWDKATGILCALSMSTAAGGQTMSISARMIETNMWASESTTSTTSSGQELWILAVVGIVIVVGVVVSAVLVWRRRRAPLSQATPTS